MTRLYRLDANAADIASAFGARVGSDPWDGGYGAPGKFAPVITAGRDFIAGPRPAGRALAPRIVPRLWGVLPPPSAHDPSGRIATARNPDSPFWIGNLRNSEFRCLIPATAIMVWSQDTDYEGRRLKRWIGLESAPIFAMLGVWKDEDVPAFALLTRAATGLARDLGAATEPLVIGPHTGGSQTNAAQTWLHGAWQSARTLLEPASQAPLVEVSAPRT